ncbi:hypothetical protein WH5701_16550, partial [Synechococcus sp. WH 5701]
ALANFETCDCFFRTGHNHFLAGDLCKLLDRSLERLGIRRSFAESAVDGDFHHLRDFVDVGEGEIFQQFGLNGLPVALLE